jgi:uncharacterized protein YjiS (DUF1127 family)
MLDPKELRNRLISMSDHELEGFGVVAKIMCSFAVNEGDPPRECFLIQLREAQEEWLRRKGVPPASF